MEEQQDQVQGQLGKKKPNLSVVWLTLGVVGMIWMFRAIFGIMYPEDGGKVYYNAELTSLTPAELCSEQGVKALEKTVGFPLYFCLLSLEADSSNQLYSVEGVLFSQDKEGKFQVYDLKSVGEHQVEGLEPYEKQERPTSLVRRSGVDDSPPVWSEPEDWIPVSLLGRLNPADSPLEQRKNEQPIPPSHCYYMTLGENETVKSHHRENIAVDGSGNLVIADRETDAPGRFIRLDGSSFVLTGPELLSQRVSCFYLYVCCRVDGDVAVQDLQEIWLLEQP